jgi:hypothetical protein
MCTQRITVSGIVSIRAVYEEVHNTSYGRSQRGRPASWKISGTKNQMIFSV